MPEKAREHKMYVVAGSILEEAVGKLYNSSTLIGPDGEVIGKLYTHIVYTKTGSVM